ncbi:MAG: hypothetical protein EOM66_10195 [Clostridia bacterium]|nr:hypothetical protein [Clostridia bacterium]
MSHAMQKREAAMALLYCFFLSLAALLICTKSSPLYPVNDWSDANIFLTMGKGMLRGKVLYRDLYDHKGPLLYGLHALAAMISSTSFLGVFLLEVAAFTAFLMSAWKIVRLYGVNGAAWPLLAVLAAGVLSSTALQAGDSAEELCLPLVSWSFYLLFKWLHRNDLSAPGRKWALFQGVLTGCVLWIKFTMLGFFGAVMLTALIRLVYRGQWKQAFSCVGWFLLGLLLTTLPWILYFGVNSGIGIWLKTYFYDNLFLYGGSKTSLAERVKEILKCVV